MEHVALGALLAVVVWLLARERRLRRRLVQLERRATTAEADAGAKTQLATVGELVSGLARQLKTPLQGVLGNTEVMLATEDAGRSEELRDIHDHAARAADIVRSLIAFSETAALSRRWQDLNEVCSRATDVARPRIVAAGNSVRMSSGERLPLVYVDGRQLENAIGAMLGHAGAVRPSRRLFSTDGPPQPIGVSTRGVDDMLIIDIDFPGVTQDAVEHALGAGELDACRHVIRAHGGRLTIDTRQAGAGVVIELPAAVVDVASPSSPQTTTQESSSPWTTLSTSSTSTESGISRS